MTTVKLSEATLDAFKKLYDIDQSLKIMSDDVETRTDEDDNEVQVTVLRSKSQNNTMMARVEVAEEFPRNVYIYDLREFNSVIGIVNDPVLDFSNDKFVVIKSADDKQKLKYIEANPDLIASYSSKVPNLTSEDVELVVSENQFKSVLSAARTMRLEFVGFKSDEGVVAFSAFNKNNGDGKDTNNFSIELAEGDVDFNLFYRLDVHKLDVLQGEGDLTFVIDGKRKISKVDTQTGKTFWIALDNNSSYSG